VTARECCKLMTPNARAKGRAAGMPAKHDDAPRRVPLSTLLGTRSQSTTGLPPRTTHAGCSRRLWQRMSLLGYQTSIRPTVRARRRQPRRRRARVQSFGTVSSCAPRCPILRPDPVSRANRARYPQRLLEQAHVAQRARETAATEGISIGPGVGAQRHLDPFLGRTTMRAAFISAGARYYNTCTSQTLRSVPRLLASSLRAAGAEARTRPTLPCLMPQRSLPRPTASARFAHLVVS
jgi:hypothetical protein